MSRSATALALAGLLAVSAAGPAAAQDDDSFRVRGIGDSVASGFGQHQNAFQNGRCAISLPTTRCDNPRESWPAKFAAGLTATDRDGLPVDFKSYAVGGATSADFDAGGRLESRVDDLIADDPDVILITLGANDLLTSTVLGKRVLEPSCLLRRGCAAKRLEKRGTVKHLKALLGRLVLATGADVLISRYYYTDQDVRGSIGKVSDAVSQAARDFADEGVTVVDPPSFRGHSCLASPKRRWMLSALRDTCIHPNHRGLLAMAGAALTGWRRANATTSAQRHLARFCGARRLGSWGPIELHATRMRSCPAAWRVARRMQRLPPDGNSPGSPKGWGCARITGAPPLGAQCSNLNGPRRTISVIEAPSESELQTGVASRILGPTGYRSASRSPRNGRPGRT
jgi:lysophospholipase L1-like esterase